MSNPVIYISVCLKNNSLRHLYSLGMNIFRPIVALMPPKVRFLNTTSTIGSTASAGLAS